MALPDLGDLGGELGNSGKLARGGLDADDGGHRITEAARVDLGPVAGDDTYSFETLDALGDRWRRQADAAPELGEGDAAVGRQLTEDLAVSIVNTLTIPASFS